jgi:ABC-type phosphate transport system substrate-binding protein
MLPRERASLAAYVPAGEGECLIVLYVNIDGHEAYTEAEVRQSYDDDMAQLAADGSSTQAPMYEQWLEEQCDLGLLVVDIDDILDEIMDE